MKTKLLIILSIVTLLAGCSPGTQVPTDAPDQPAASDGTAVTANGDASKGTEGERTINVELSKFAFDPNLIEVNQGDIVHLTLTSKDATHGFKIDDYGINEIIKGGDTVDLTFTADKKGTFSFYCSVPCGPGHSDMNGQLIVK